MSRGGDDFLGRWSARKLKARDAPEPAEPAPPAAPLPAAGPEPDRPDEDILRELGLPDPDSLVKGDDFRAFLKSAVPARLRNRALRRLWVSDPVLANLDGLNDYDKDFTDAATVVKNLKTSYRIGRGMLRDDPPEAAEAAAGQIADAAPDAAPAVTAPPPEAPAGEVGAAPVPADDAGPTGAGEAAGDRDETDPAEPDRTAAAPDDAADPPADTQPRPSRMRFRFGA